MQERTFPEEHEMMEYTPTEAPEVPEAEEEDERSWKDVAAQEEAYKKEDEERVKEIEGRRRKGKSPEGPTIERELKAPRNLFQQMEVMVSEHEMTGRLKKKAVPSNDLKAAQNQWLPRSEVQQLGRLLDATTSKAMFCTMEGHDSLCEARR